MATVWVLDHTAVAGLPSLVPAAGLEAFLLALETEVEQGRVTFPTPVRDHCQMVLREERMASWVRAAARLRVRKTVSWDYTSQVIDEVPDLLDDDAEEEASPPCSVAAMAIMLSEDDDLDEVVVVTSEDSDLPTRRSLTSACADLALETCSPRDFVTDCGLGAHLAP